MIRRLVTRLLLLLVVTFLGWANTHTTAVAVPSAGAASYTYDSPIPNEPTDCAASDSGPPMQLVTSIAPAGQVVVDHWSDGTSARPNVSASVVTCNYDCAPQFVQVVHGDNTGAQLVGAFIRNLSALQPALVAANAGSKLLRPGSLADEVANATGGVVKANKGGYTVNVPNGSRGITVRVMERGGSRTNYYRVSVPGKETYTVTGKASMDANLTHIGIGESSLDDLVSIVSRIQGGG